MGISAADRASLCLSGTTAMTPEQVFETLTQATTTVKGIGKASDLAFATLSSIGAHVDIMQRTSTEMKLAMNSGKNLIELCTFRARVASDGSGRTRVTVGGLDTYKTSQEKLMYFIPVGPKYIKGMAQYKNFLNGLSGLLTAKDSTAQLQIAQAA